MSEQRLLAMRQERTQSAHSSHGRRNRCMAHSGAHVCFFCKERAFPARYQTKWLSKMASSSNHNGEGFKVAIESILQRPIKEINYEGEETYEE